MHLSIPSNGFVENQKPVKIDLRLYLNLVLQVIQFGVRYEAMQAKILLWWSEKRNCYSRIHCDHNSPLLSMRILLKVLLVVIIMITLI